MLIEEFTSESLTSEQWETAQSIAKTLVEDSTDVNELNKIITYLKTFVEQENAKEKFFKYLEILAYKTAPQDSPFARSKQTPEYYRSIHKACQDYLQDYQDNGSVLLEILGWTSRLMRYYKVTPNNYQTPPPPSERIQKIEQLNKSHTFEVGNILEAKVIKKNSTGSQVSYEIFGITFTEKESKRFSLIPENQMVKVEIKSLRDNGSINHVKFFKAN